MPGEKREKQEHQQLKNRRKRQKENFHSFRITLYECQNGAGMPPTARHNSGLQGGPDRGGNRGWWVVCVFIFFLEHGRWRSPDNWPGFCHLSLLLAVQTENSISCRVTQRQRQSHQRRTVFPLSRSPAFLGENEGGKSGGDCGGWKCAVHSGRRRKVDIQKCAHFAQKNFKLATFA